MIYRDDAAISYLAAKLRSPDSNESSHWEHYAATIEYDGSQFLGLRGFGGCAQPHNWFGRLAHRLLQKRYRRIASTWDLFRYIDATAASLVSLQKRAYDLDVLRQSITLAFLEHYLGGRLSGFRTACVIGDGFGTMTSLLLASGLIKKVVLVNLRKVLLVDLSYLRTWLGAVGRGEIALAKDISGLRDSFDDPAVAAIAIEAEDQGLLDQCNVDLAVNIVSMQEMNPPVIARYFASLRHIALRRPVAFYCCNRLEKRLPDDTIVRFMDYPWLPDDRVIVNELCQWHQEYYRLAPPFYRSFDGPIWHRLCYLAPALAGKRECRC